MSLDLITEIAQQSIIVTLKVSAPVLLVSLAIGLFISILQTTTSIQEQTLTFVPKIIAIMITVFLTISLMAQELIGFTRYLLEKIPGMWK
jgi:flagellar biosynthetic protein FliQ